MIDRENYKEHSGIKYVTAKQVKKTHGVDAAGFDAALTMYAGVIVNDERCMVASEYEKWAAKLSPDVSQ